MDEIICRIKQSIVKFTEDPISNLGCLFPFAIGLISLVSGIVTYIMFIVDGGYSTQVAVFKKYGLFSGIGRAFTTGTTGKITTGIVGKVLLVIVIAELIVMLTNYFKGSGKTKRIIMIVDLTALTILTVLTTILLKAFIDKYEISKEALMVYLSGFDIIAINPKAVIITYAIIMIVSYVAFFVMILITKECRWMVGYTCLSLVFANIVTPLFFLLLQNIIPVAGAIIVIILLVIVVRVIEVMITETPEDIEWKKKELARTRERSNSYKASANANFKSARDGLNIITSAQEKRERGIKDLEKASAEDDYAQKLQEDIERLEEKFGKQE